MVELNTLAKMFEEQLNNNKYGIVFDIAADRNTYDKRKNKAADFVVPGVLTAQTGNYEPLQGIKVYYMPINLELFAFAGLHNEPFTWEQQKECVDVLVSELNGTTQEYGDSAVVFEGAVVTVGNISGQSGGSYCRVPMLVQLRLVVVGKAVLFNDQKVTIDGSEVMFSSWSVGLTRQGESVTKVGTTVGKTLCDQMTRTFSGIAYMTGGQPFVALQNEILTGETINAPHTIVYTLNETEYTFEVIIVSATITGQSGAVMQMTINFAEVYANA